MTSTTIPTMIHVPRSNQHDRSVLNNAQLNILVDKVFARVLDLAQTRRVHFNASVGRYELDTLDAERLRQARALNNAPRLDYFLPSDDSLTTTGQDVKFMVLNHTCPVCLASYETGKVLVRHFTSEHVVAKSAHKCSICERFMSLDEFYKHCFCDEAHMSFYLVKEFRLFYSIFMVKFIQDTLVNHYTNGSCCILKLRNSTSSNSSSQQQQQSQTSKQTASASSQSTSLIERMSTKMNEIFFGRPATNTTNSNTNSANNNATNSSSSTTSTTTCKPLNCLSSKSIRSNLACNNKRVSQADLVAEMLKYAQLDAEQASSAAQFLKSQSAGEKTCYLQCTLCFTLLDDHPDELKLHIVKSHVYNENLNKCMVCCYCRQILKTNNDQVNIVDLFNEHVMSNECCGVKQGLMPAVSVDWFLNNKNTSKKRKLDCLTGEVVPLTAASSTSTTTNAAGGGSHDYEPVVVSAADYNENEDDENGLVESNYTADADIDNNNDEYFDEEEAAVVKHLNNDDDDNDGEGGGGGDDDDYDGGEVDFEGDDDMAVVEHFDASNNISNSKRLKNDG